MNNEIASLGDSNDNTNAANAEENAMQQRIQREEERRRRAHHARLRNDEAHRVSFELWRRVEWLQRDDPQLTTWSPLLSPYDPDVMSIMSGALITWLSTHATHRVAIDSGTTRMRQEPDYRTTTSNTSQPPPSAQERNMPPPPESGMRSGDPPDPRRVNMHPIPDSGPPHEAYQTRTNDASQPPLHAYTDVDFICARGDGGNNHPMNQWFWKHVIRPLMEKYDSTEKGMKWTVCKEAWDILRSWNGRFMKKCGDTYYEMNPKATYQMLGQKFRDALETETKRQKDDTVPAPIIQLKLEGDHWRSTKPICLEVVKALMAHQRGRDFFNDPVDPKMWKATDYFDVIQRPMDLGTILKKAVDDCYRSVEEFESDVYLTFDNAMLYNPETHLVHMLAKEMKDWMKATFTVKIKNFIKPVQAKKDRGSKRKSKKQGSNSKPKRKKEDHAKNPVGWSQSALNNEVYTLVEHQREQQEEEIADQSDLNPSGALEEKDDFLASIMAFVDNESHSFYSDASHEEEISSTPLSSDGLSDESCNDDPSPEFMNHILNKAIGLPQDSTDQGGFEDSSQSLPDIHAESHQLRRDIPVVDGIDNIGDDLERKPSEEPPRLLDQPVHDDWSRINIGSNERDDFERDILASLGDNKQWFMHPLSPISEAGVEQHMLDMFPSSWTISADLDVSRVFEKDVDVSTTFD